MNERSETVHEVFKQARKPRRAVKTLKGLPPGASVQKLYYLGVFERQHPRGSAQRC